MNFPKFWALGQEGHFTSWKWSNSSFEEAQREATQAAQRLATQFARQGRRALDRYGYTDRPLREPVIQELRDSMGDVAAVVTRNSYGCQVLNTTRAMFVDVDLPKPSAAEKIGGLFSGLFGRKSAPLDPVQLAIAKADDFAQRQSGWNWRIYQTRGGLRLLATHALFHPADSFSQAVFDAVGADPLYRRLCQTQDCFRARLTPKPWRCATPHPPVRWPFPDHSAELAFEAWDDGYRIAIRDKASCKLLSAGNGRVHSDLQPLVTLHDDMTKATSSLPLA